MTNYQRNKLKHKLMKLIVASGSESSSEDSSDSANRERKTTLGSQKPMAKIILQFFWH